MSERVGVSIISFFAVSCSVGTYHDKNTRQCKVCSRGTYQDKEGQTTCKPCMQVQLGIGILGAVNMTQCTSKYELYISYLYINVNDFILQFFTSSCVFDRICWRLFRICWRLFLFCWSLFQIRILMFITITRSISLCIPSSKCFGIDLVYEHIFTLKYTLENTKGAIKNGQFRETDHIGYTICVGHKYVVHHFTIPPIEQYRLLSSSLTRG